MRKHFLGVLIICFLSVFSVLSFAKRSGPLTAEASIYKKRSQTVAKAKVQATVSARHGAWAISAVSGRKSDGDAGHYRYGPIYPICRPERLHLTRVKREG